MKADQLNEFDKKDFQDNEAHNLHSENAVEIAKAFGTPEEVEAMERIMDQHMRRGHILPNEIEERNALVSKYYSMLESSVNPTFRSTLEGYKVLPPMDKEKYQSRDGLEGPFSTLSGKVVYYDPKAGSYYDPDTDMYISYSDFQKLDNDYSGMGDEEADDFVKDIEPKETVKGPRGHLRSIVADDLNEIDCWDGYRKDGTKPGTGKNKGKRVNNCVKEKDLKEFGPDERYMKVGNNTMIANKKTGSFSSTLSLGGDKSATVNNHLNKDGSMGKVSARGTVNVAGTPVKFKGSNNISGNNFKGSVSAGGMTVNASKKPKMKKEGKYVSDAQRKAVHASKAEKK